MTLTTTSETRRPARARSRTRREILGDDPLWYKDAIIYQLHVRAFADSNGDGIGDFVGLTGKLDYLRDLGVNTIWLLPFYPSPLKDDGYDIAEYTGIHPDYGSLGDFRQFLRQAHKRGLRVITELVLNHTSDQHSWFQRARRAPAGSAARDFYVWSDNQKRYKDTRIIFKDFEISNWSWDPVANAYFWHRFYNHQPDLNFDNPEVRKSVYQVLDFWLEMGVDGLRLDAVPYLIEREGTSCENLPETHQILQELRQRVDSRYGDRMLLAEANQWPEDAVAYFGSGDECHMAFHFPLMPRMFMALRMEDRYPIVDILSQTPAIPASCQWALFLRNHDELTLEMVTDEERDYMYRVYANDPRARINLGIRRRLAPLLGNDRRRIELLNGLLMALPGTPVIYYGDEIGMGDNVYLGDRNGVRTPMQWSPDRNAGFSRANAQRLYLPVIIDPGSHYESVNVETHQAGGNSLLWWMRRLIALRRRFRAFGRGSIDFLYPDNRKVVAFIRRHEAETILVVANLSRHSQYVELDLSDLKGMIPVELFGGSRFPPIGELTYLLTMGPHAFYWFSLETSSGEEAVEPSDAAAIPVIRLDRRWEDLFGRPHRDKLERVLPAYLVNRRWFAGKARRIESVALRDVVRIVNAATPACLCFAAVNYTEGDPESYLLPIAFLTGERAERLEADHPQEIIARLETREGQGLLADALNDRDLCSALLEAIIRRRRYRGVNGEIAASLRPCGRAVLGEQPDKLEPVPMRTEQSNSSILYGDRAILKLYRRIDHGLNPDLEIGRFLTEQKGFPHTPPVAGAIEYRAGREEPITLGILQGFVPNEGDAWSYTLDVLDRYFERVAVERDPRKLPRPAEPILGIAEGDLPEVIREHIGTYLGSAVQLGTRTADLHLALASESVDPAFAPESFTPFHRRSVYQSMRNQTAKVFDLLRGALPGLSEEVAREARALLDRKENLLARFHAIQDLAMTALRTRVHGDYHLGQVLFTGRNFVIIDFEGEPSHSLNVRRLKRSPLRDVAGMIRSFDYAAQTSLQRQAQAGFVHAGGPQVLEAHAGLWTDWVTATYLGAYRGAAVQGGFLPDSDEEYRSLLSIYLLEKAVYELGYELNSRPEWVTIPLRGISRILDRKDASR